MNDIICCFFIIIVVIQRWISVHESFIVGKMHHGSCGRDISGEKVAVAMTNKCIRTPGLEKKDI